MEFCDYVIIFDRFILGHIIHIDNRDKFCLFDAFSLARSSGFQLSPDFRQRAPSNASSTGRLSPIASMIPSEPDWASEYTPAGDFSTNSDYSQVDYAQEEQLAGSLADSMKLHGADPFLNT